MNGMLKRGRAVILLLGLLFVFGLPLAGRGQSRCPGWADASSRYLDEMTLAACTCPELDLLGNEIYARHGKVFNDRADLDAYFRKQPWYKPDPEAIGNRGLNQFEVWNADLVSRYLKNSGCVLSGPPGVCPIWPAPRLSPLEDRDLSACSCRQLELLHQEIFARHGKIFSDRPDLKDYFGRQFWYTPDGTNPEGKRGMNGYEERNVAIILAHEQGRGCIAPVVPGPPCPTWPAPQMRSLTPEELTPCSCKDLETLRHEIPARHGKVFTDPALRAYFKAQPWYVPDPDNPSGDRGQNIFERENAIILQETANKRPCQPPK